MPPSIFPQGRQFFQLNFYNPISFRLTFLPSPNLVSNAMKHHKAMQNAKKKLIFSCIMHVPPLMQEWSDHTDV